MTTNNVFSNISAINAMKRNEKLKILQDSLQGQTNQLQQLHQERRKKLMPYLEAHAIIDAHNCPPELLDITVFYGEIDERPFLQKSLRGWLALLDELGQISQYGDDMATGFIDANDSQCLNPLNDWTKLQKQFSPFTFRYHEQDKAEFYSRRPLFHRPGSHP